MGINNTWTKRESITHGLNGINITWTKRESITHGLTKWNQ